MTQEEKIDYVAIANKLKQEFKSPDIPFINVNDLRSMIERLEIQIPEDVLEEAIACGDVNEDETNIHFYVC
jgi:hypothetical protein